MKKNLNVFGFCKGKVLCIVFNCMYGEEVLYEDVLNVVLLEVYEVVVLEVGIELVV